MLDESPDTGLTAWPPEFAARYRERGCWRDEALGAMLRQWARSHGDRTALVSEERRWTYRELDSAADRLAAGLRQRGIRAGDRVVVQLPNIGEFVVLSFALFRLGALPVYALPPHRHSEITYLCQFSGAVAYVVPDAHEGFDYRALAADVREQSADLAQVFVVGDPGEFTGLSAVDADPEDGPAPDPADVAMFLLSGGTTGLPKLIPRTHNDYAYNLSASAEVCGFTPDTAYLAALPAAHNFPLGCPGVFGTLHAGGKVVMAPNGSPHETFGLVERERITVTALVPPLALLWMEAAEWADEDLSSLRLLQVGGSKFKESPARRVRSALGCELQQVFGMAEGMLCYTRLDDPEEVVMTTQGRPMSTEDEFRVVDGEGNPVSPGELGELEARGPYTLRGYYHAPQHNSRSFTADGFYRTGDLVRLDESGNLCVEGRIKDVINRGGDKVPVEEVENHLLAHPEVHDVALVGMPDDLYGERTCAYVVPRDEHPALPELNTFLKERGVAEFKLPDHLEVVASLPATVVGKVNKVALASDIATRSPSS